MKISCREKFPPALQCSLFRRRVGRGGQVRLATAGPSGSTGSLDTLDRLAGRARRVTSWLTREAAPPRVADMQRHRGLFVVILLLAAAGFGSWYATKTWEGWEYILDIVGKGDNMPIAGLIPIIAFFTYLSMDEAFRHDRLIKQGREDEILDEMYK